MLGVDAAAVEYHGGAVPLWALVTPLREPVTHYLAWFHYFAEPDTRMSLEQWVGTRRGINGARGRIARLIRTRSRARLLQAWPPNSG
jgi:hypothetical protein